MAELLPHFKSRVPGYWTIPKGESLLHTEVPHPMAGNFPSDVVYATGTVDVDLANHPLDPDGGIAGPILAATEITTATAGVAPAAGVWAPANAVPPYDLAELQSIDPTADPAIAIWTIGQYMILGDGSFAHWNGTAWAAGKSPGA